MTPPRFLPNTHARIPFSVIGIFLILGSSIVSVYVARLEMQQADSIASSLDMNQVDTLLHAAESDITTALNIAGMKGLRMIGKNPVIVSSLGLAEDINSFRLRRMIRDQLNQYLTGHFLYNTYTDGRYAINVILHNDTPIPQPDLISLHTTEMCLERPTLPFIGPDAAVTHPVYMIASVPIDIEIRDRADPSDTAMTQRTLLISTILTSRYPLLKALIDEFHRTINGTFSPLWNFTTALSNVYSLLRSYKHYRTGEPRNVVDNRHLAVLVNTGLLLEQGLVFSSIDPLGIIEQVQKTRQLLKEQAQDPLAILNQDLNRDCLNVQTDNLTRGTANIDAGEALNATIDDRFSFNLSEIASHMLYNITSVTLWFENDEGDTETEDILYDETAEQRIKEVTGYWANHSYILTHVSRQLERNDTTYHLLPVIASEVYHDEMCIQVTDRAVTNQDVMNPGAGWTDGGAGPWFAVGFIPVSKDEVTPPRGHVAPGSALYNETYNVTYYRTHSWFRLEEYNISGNITLVQLWENQTDVRNEIVLLQEILQNYAGYGGTENDVNDVLYYNATLNDPNLEDTLTSILNRYPDSDPLKQELLFTQDNQGNRGCFASISGLYPGWVINESWGALNTIVGSLVENSSQYCVNASASSDPITLVKQAADEAFNVFIAHSEEYLDRARYQADSLFYSVGKKTVFATCDWFITTLNTSFTSMVDAITSELEAALTEALPSTLGCTAQNFTQTLDDTAGAIRNQVTIPFGLNMTLSHRDNDSTVHWNETVRLAVDQQPNFLNPYEPINDHGEELWSLKLRNRCLFGPTGLLLLPPTPLTPWLLTLNLWAIDVEGEYTHFKIIDTSDETIFNPLLGHEAQAYVREEKVVTEGNVTLGENTRVSFKFTTLAFGVVPAWGMMLGDLQPNWYDEHTPGFDQGT